MKIAFRGFDSTPKGVDSQTKGACREFRSPAGMLVCIFEEKRARFWTYPVLI